MLVVGDTLLRGIEAPICWPENRIFFDHYSLFGWDGTHLSRRGRAIFGSGLNNLVSFKQEDSRGGVQSGNTYTTATNCGISQANRVVTNFPYLPGQIEPEGSHLTPQVCVAQCTLPLGNKQEELELRASVRKLGCHGNN